jgi:hypothetical protein
MKTNLHSLFSSNKDYEKDGVEFVISNTCSMVVRRFGGANVERVKSANAKYYKPYARIIQNGAMPEDQQRSLMIRAFVDACIVSWKGVCDDEGKEIPFTIDNAVKLFTELDELFESIFEYANDVKTYKEDVGNS